MLDSDSSSQAPVKAGDVLADKYEVEQVLGVGGMGVVVAARHIHLGGRVALKFLRPSAVESPEVVSRFKREAQAATKIKSEHVARVIDVGSLETGSPYMVMEYLEGSDLGQLLSESGPLPIWDAVDYLMQAMEAIAEAHSFGIVHRDLKPSNLFLTRRSDDSPLIKVLDFGISKAQDAMQQQALTQTAGVMGSPLYMSPEQIRSTKHVDPRADIWSLGVILYELLAGHSPFSGGESAGAVFAAILSDPAPPLRPIRPDVPPELEAAINLCLAKKADDRYPNVAALAAALAPFGGTDSQTSVARITRLLAKTDATVQRPGKSVIAVTTPMASHVPFSDSGAKVAGSQPSIDGSATPGAWGSATGQPVGTTGFTKSKSQTPVLLAVGGGIAVFALLAVAIGGIALSRKGSDAPGAQPPASAPIINTPTPEPSPNPPPTVAAPTPTTETPASAAPSAEPPSTKTGSKTTRTTTAQPAKPRVDPKTVNTDDKDFGHR